jgi:uncharacterized protein YoxC
MTAGEPFLGGTLYVFFAVAILLAVVIIQILFRRNTKQKIEELEEQVADLERNQMEGFAALEQQLGSLKDISFDKTNLLTKKLHALSKRIELILEKSEEFGEEVDRKVDPLKTMVDDSITRINAAHDTMRKRISQGDKLIDKMAKDIAAFSRAIKEMKDFIRERNIDLEL